MNPTVSPAFLVVIILALSSLVFVVIAEFLRFVKEDMERGLSNQIEEEEDRDVN